MWVTATLERWALPGVTTDLLRGLGLWINLTLDTAPGLLLGFSQVMVLVAIAVSLATRVPMVVNLVAVVVVFFLAHLTPVLVSIGYAPARPTPARRCRRSSTSWPSSSTRSCPTSTCSASTPLCSARRPSPPVAFAKFLGSVSLYGLLYTSIVLLFGLILFEDRDLA